MLGSVDLSSRSAIFIVGLVRIVAAAGLVMFWKSKPNNASKETKIRENAFRLTLPGNWVQKPSSDPTRWIYQYEEGHRQLTVSLLSSTHRMSGDEQTDTLKRIVEISRRGETEVARESALTISETTFAESHGVLAARFGGIEAANHRRFARLLLCSPWAVTTYYYEDLDSTEAEFESEARATMNSIVVPR
jgi:hypothetical protein